MVSISISEAREHLAELGGQVAAHGERIVVDKHNKHLFALVPMEDLELIERLEDQLDIQAYEERKNEPSISLEQVKKDLGL